MHTVKPAITTPTLFPVKGIQKGDVRTKLTEKLLSASKSGRTGAVKKLVMEGANINGTNVSGETPLMWAAINNQPEDVKFLVEQGANLDARDKVKWTALMWAAMYKHIGIVRILVDAGADSSPQDASGMTARILADEQESVVKLLDKKHKKKTQKK